MTRSPALSLVVLLALSACGGDGAGAALDAGPGIDSGAADRACVRDPRPVDGPRFGVVSHPFAAGGGQSDVYEVFAIDATGVIAMTGETLSMGRSTSDTIAFTIDGQIGVVAQTDGSLGVFALDASGVPTVIETGYEGEFYASEVRMDGGGSRVMVLDGEFRNIGGGVYSVAIDCDGNLIEEGLLAASQLPGDVADVGDAGRRLIPADDILDSPAGFDVHLIDVTAGAAEWIAGANLFGTQDAIVSDAAVTSSGEFALVGDNCGFCDGDNRVAVAAISGDSIEHVQTITPFEDPYDLVSSPFDDRVLVISGFGNAVFELVPSGNAAAPYGEPVEMSYTGSPPQLPGNPVMIERGSLEGLVFLPENLGVRRIQFEAAGTAATDLGLFSFGTGTESIVGSVGVQP